MKQPWEKRRKGTTQLRTCGKLRNSYVCMYIYHIYIYMISIYIYTIIWYIMIYIYIIVRWYIYIHNPYWEKWKSEFQSTWANGDKNIQRPSGNLSIIPTADDVHIGQTKWRWVKQWIKNNL
jgi:hypothetical protein